MNQQFIEGDVREDSRDVHDRTGESHQQYFFEYAVRNRIISWIKCKVKLIVFNKNKRDKIKLGQDVQWQCSVP